MTQSTIQIIAAISATFFSEIIVFAVGWGKVQQKLRDLDKEVQFLKEQVYQQRKGR